MRGGMGRAGRARTDLLLGGGLREGGARCLCLLALGDKLGLEQAVLLLQASDLALEAVEEEVLGLLGALGGSNVALGGVGNAPGQDDLPVELLVVGLDVVDALVNFVELHLEVVHCRRREKGRRRACEEFGNSIAARSWRYKEAVRKGKRRGVAAASVRRENEEYSWNVTACSER